ncbi:MAG: hypothetical protein WAK48_04400, partial [Candidatus Acidiferrum sp.]
FMKAESIAEAAIKAGYSPKNPSQSGNQALNAILRKGPDAMEASGLSLPAVIEHHLVPLLHWNETKFAQHEGKFTDHVTVANGAIRLGAVEKAFRLLGAYPSEDPVLNSKISVDVIICDMPRKRFDVEPVDVKPTVRPPRKELNAPAPAVKPAAPLGNGAKPDPRPKD